MICRSCPVRRFRVGAFDVADRPKSSTRFDRETGCRTLPESGVPVCVHPDRVGLPPGAYASAGTALPYLRRLWLRIRLAASTGASPMTGRGSRRDRPRRGHRSAPG